VIPLLNKSVATLGRPVCYLSDTVCLRTLDDEIYGALHRYESRDYRSLINSNTKCLYFDASDVGEDGVSPCEWKNYTREQARKVQTLLNMLSDGSPAILAPAAIMRRKRKVRVIQTVELASVADIHHWQRLRLRFNRN
jgi:hypothetical protein